MEVLMCLGAALICLACVGTRLPWVRCVRNFSDGPVGKAALVADPTPTANANDTPVVDPTPKAR